MGRLPEAGPPTAGVADATPTRSIPIRCRGRTCPTPPPPCLLPGRAPAPLTVDWRKSWVHATCREAEAPLRFADARALARGDRRRARRPGRSRSDLRRRRQGSDRSRRRRVSASSPSSRTAASSSEAGRCGRRRQRGRLRRAAPDAPGNSRSRLRRRRRLVTHRLRRDDTVTGVGRQSDGRIVATVRNLIVGLGDGLTGESRVVRLLNPGGTLDPAFGAGAGFVQPRFSRRALHRGHGAPDDRVVIAGDPGAAAVRRT